MADAWSYSSGTGTAELTPRGITRTQAESLVRPALTRALQSYFGNPVTVAWTSGGKVRVTFPFSQAVTSASIASATRQLQAAATAAEREVGGSGRLLLSGASAERPTAIAPTGRAIGQDAGRRVAGTVVRVSATWAQSAINAYRTARTGSLITVDGRAGPVTIRALTAIASELGAASPAPRNDPSTRTTTDAVVIGQQLETALSAFPAVTAPRRTRSSGTTAGTATTPDGTERVVEGEEPDKLQEYLPYIIGGSVAFVALGLGAVILRRRRSVQPNRRRLGSGRGRR